MQLAVVVDARGNTRQLSRLESLPTEVVEKISGYLDSVLSLRKTSKELLAKTTKPFTNRYCAKLKVNLLRAEHVQAVANMLAHDDIAARIRHINFAGHTVSADSTNSDLYPGLLALVGNLKQAVAIIVDHPLILHHSTTRITAETLLRTNSSNILHALASVQSKVKSLRIKEFSFNNDQIKPIILANRDTLTDLDITQDAFWTNGNWPELLVFIKNNTTRLANLQLTDISDRSGGFVPSMSKVNIPKHLRNTDTGAIEYYSIRQSTLTMAGPQAIDACIQKVLELQQTHGA